MKYILSILFCLSLIACKQNKPPQSETSKTEVKKVIDDPNWLLGDWKRTNNKEGKQTYEYWDKDKHGHFLSMGCTLEGSDTTWMETVLLHKVDDVWMFEVSMQGGTTPTVFKVTQIDNKSFTCENPENDFPKQISYSFDGEKLHAEISGGGPTIPYDFVKMD